MPASLLERARLRSAPYGWFTSGPAPEQCAAAYRQLGQTYSSSATGARQVALDVLDNRRQHGPERQGSISVGPALTVEQIFYDSDTLISEEGYSSTSRTTWTALWRSTRSVTSL